VDEWETTNLMCFRNGIYDTLGRMSGGMLKSTSSGAQVYAFSSGWKGAQLQSSSDTVLGQTSSYAYDGFNRLLSRTANSVQDYTWTYDRYGNRWTQNGAGQSFNTATNRLSTGGYAYDAAGNMTYDGFNSYTYDAEGNITAVTGNTSATYVYNALNQRVRTVTSSATTEFVFNANGQRVSEWNGTTRAQLKGKYYWGGLPVAYYTTAGSGSAGAHFEHSDWLGTERMRTTYNSANNPTYAVEASYTSLPWGDAQTPAANGSDAAHYAQLDHDAETNTDHADFRQYSNAQGRWLSPDPYDGSYDGSNPQSMNRYVYSMNNPLSYVDPSGQDCVYEESGGTTFIKSGDCYSLSDPGTYVDCGDAGDGCMTGGKDSKLIAPLELVTVSDKDLDLTLSGYDASQPGAGSSGNTAPHYAIAGSIGIPTPIPVIQIVVPLAWVPSTNTKCAGIGAGISTPGRTFSGGLVRSDQDIVGVLGGWSISGSAQDGPYGIQTMRNSSGTARGNSAGTQGAGVSATWSWCW